MATAGLAPDINANSPQGYLAAVRQILGTADREVLGAWAVWAFMTLAGFGLVAIYGLPFPFGIDEWRWVGQVTGDEPVTLSWLWSQHNEHRMFLPRLIYLGLGTLTGFDFRAGCFFNVCMLSGLSLAMMKAARAVRGKTLLCDAFFPLVLLHWGQFDNLIWGFQLNFVTSVVLEGAVLLIVLRCRSKITLKSAALATLCLVLLGLCGSYGLVFLPPMACWLFYAAVRKWIGGGPWAKRNALIIIAFSLIPAALVGLYVHGLNARPEYMGFYASLRTGIEFLSFGIGPAAKEIWPLSGLLAILVCGMMLRKCLMVFRNQPEQRLRTAGFLLFFSGIIALAAAIGFGRAYIGPMGGFETRYITLAAPLLLLLFFLYQVHGSPSLKRRVPRTLFVLMSALLVINTQKGISYTQNIWKNLLKLEQDMRNGMPAEAMGVRYADQWGYASREMISTRLAWLQKARLGLYRSPTTQSGHADRVECICRQGPATKKIEPIRLKSGQSFEQAFSVQEDGELRRIDVQILIPREARRLKRLDWSLLKIAADGKQNLLAGDCIDPAKTDGDDYISIPLKGVYACKNQQFMLKLAIPADASPQAFVAIPLYAAAENRELPRINDNIKSRLESKPAGMMSGFIFLESAGPSIPLVARLPGTENTR